MLERGLSSSKTNIKLRKAWIFTRDLQYLFAKPQWFGKVPWYLLNYLNCLLMFSRFMKLAKYMASPLFCKFKYSLVCFNKIWLQCFEHNLSKVVNKQLQQVIIYCNAFSPICKPCGGIAI